MLRKLVVTAAVLSSLASASAHAASLFVATTGNDANAGTSSAPLRTITKAASLAKPGDIVEVRGGVYNEVVRVLSKGTATARIVVRSYPGERAIVDGTGTAADTNLFTISGAEYVDIVGFEIRDSTRIGLNSYASKYVRLLNNVVHDTYGNGIRVGSSSTIKAYDVVVDGNEVFHTCLQNQYHTTTGGWGQAVAAVESDKVRITNNLVYENDGNGIMFIVSSNGYARGNELYDNFSTSFYLDNAQQTVVDGNLIYSTGNTRYYRDGLPAHGIGLSNESYSVSLPLDGLTITNNIVLFSRQAFFYNNQENGGGMKNVTVTNNTFYGATYAMLAVDDDAHVNSVIENNIFCQNGGAKLDVVAGAGVTYRNNLWYGGTIGGAAGAGDRYADPRFASAGGFDPEDYMLTALSPAIGTGLNRLTLVKLDYFGTARVLPFDIGAHQRSGLVADTQAPTAPASLRAMAGDHHTLNIAWTAATDNVGVSTYTITRNGAFAATTSGTTWTDPAVVQGTLYVYQVFANDAAGNQSTGSNVVKLAWDTKELVAPQSIRATAIDSTTVTVRWDAVEGAQSYTVYRDGSQVATLTRTAWSDTNLTPGKSYTYTVIARDASNTRSAESEQAVVVMPANNGKRRAARS